MRRFNSKLSRVGDATEWLKRKIQFKAMLFEVRSYIKIHFSEIQATDCISLHKLKFLNHSYLVTSHVEQEGLMFTIFMPISCVCVCVCVCKF